MLVHVELQASVDAGGSQSAAALPPHRRQVHALQFFGLKCGAAPAGQAAMRQQQPAAWYLARQNTRTWLLFWV